MQIVKPPHNRYILSKVSDETYSKYADQYSSCKRYGIRGIYAWCSGVGIFGVVKEIATDSIVYYGKQRLGYVIITVSSYLLGPAIKLVTNATNIVKLGKQAHSAAAFVFEVAEDSSNLTLFPIDILIFGQAIPVGDKDRFNIISNTTVFFNIK